MDKFGHGGYGPAAMLEPVVGLQGLTAAASDAETLLELSLSCTAVELARERSGFERVFAELAGRERRVRLRSVALPNFSATELERLGAEIDATEALVALRNLFELEALFRGTFRFRGHARFDTVLLTPWSTTADLAINLRVVRALGLYAEFEGLLRSRSRHGDPAWLHPTLEPLHQMLRELGDGPDAFARALALVEGPPRAAGARHVTVRGDLRAVEACERAREFAVREHFKPIHRPTIAPAKLPEAIAELRRRFGPEIAHASTPHDAQGSAIDLVYGIDEAEVQEFVELARRSNLQTSLDDRDAINRRIGELLGYPACCVDAFLRTAPIEEDITERTLLARRLGQGPLDPRWPLLLIVYEHYLPCSLHCEESLALGERLERALLEHGIAAPDGGWGHVVFFSDLEQPGNVAVLLRGSVDARGFDYRVVALNSEAPVLAPLADGNRIEFGAQTTTVLHDGEPVHTWAGNVAVLDVEREWGDSAWFRAHFEAQLTAASHAWERERAHAPTPVAEPIDEPFPITAERARVLLESLCPPGVRVARCESRRVGSGDVEWIQIQLTGELGEFPITIIPRANAIHGVAARFDGRVSEQQSLLRTLAERLDERAITPLPGSPPARVLELVGEVTHPTSGEFRTFAGFAACMPVCDRKGEVRLALAAHGEVLELIIAPRQGRESWPGKTSHCAVAHVDTRLRSDRARAAFARFVQRLREVERG